MAFAYDAPSVSAARRLAPLVVAVCFVAAGCSRGGSGRASATVSARPPPPATNPIVTTPGSYLYVNAGLTARLKLAGSNGTLEIQNASGHELGKPGLYVLDARTGAEFEGMIASASPVPDGQTRSFVVSFAPGLALKDIGLVVLLAGGQNLGAFAPA